MDTSSPVDAGTHFGSRHQAMQPISFGGCFGWFHTIPANIDARTAVVLCPGLKTDELTGYRSLRLLADTLAAAGFPTLRFHYPGTGNSFDPGAVEHWSGWRQSIHAAVEWLRDNSGAERVVLGGLRIGATLAAVVAEERADVVGLMLMAPVVRGRSYVRQLAIEVNVWRGTKDYENLAVGGVQLSAETLRMISQSDLRKVKLPADLPVAIYAETPSTVLSECVQAWSKNGVVVEVEDFTGLEPMLRPTFLSHEVPVAPARMVAWLCDALPTTRTAPLPSTSRLPSSCVPGGFGIRTAEWIETPLRFGADAALFGILCRPSGGPEADVIVVIGNTSGDPHCAPVAVDLSRRLADRGFASLRMDFAGLGDSIAPGDDGTHVIETDRSHDIMAALDALTGLGFRRFAIQGLCSGAYHAFHAAVADPRISMALLVNLPQLEWHPGDVIEVQVLATQSPFNTLKKVVNKHSWSVLLQGRFNLRSRTAGLGIWFVRSVRAGWRRIAGLFGFRLGQDFAWDSLDRLSRQAETVLLFAKGDPGIAALKAATGWRRTPPNVTMRISADLDHSLTRVNMRRIVSAHMIELLTRALPGPVVDRTGVENGSRRGRDSPLVSSEADLGVHLVK